MLRIGTEGKDVEILHSILSLYFKLEVEPSKTKEFSSDTKKLVQRFQVEKGLSPDGIVGAKTLAMLFGVFSSSVLSPNRVVKVVESKKYSFVECKADKYIDSATRKEEGFDKLFLREDAAEAFNKAAEDMRSFGAIVTTAGGRRWFTAKVSAGRIATSVHYTGLAFDLAIGSGMQNIDKDPYVVQRIAERTYRVYARCDKSKATNENFPKKKVAIKDCVTYFERVKGETCKADYFIDITEIFEKYGFKSIRAHSNFETSKHPQNMMSAEFWHFQYEKALEKGKSTFGGELLKIASESEIKKHPHLWENRNKVWGVSWF